MFRQKKHAWQVCAFVVAALLLAGLLATGGRHYEIWGQIDYLHRAAFDFSSLPTAGMMAHLPRYIVVSPSYLIAGWLGMDPNRVFGWYVYLLVCLTAWIWLRVRIEVSMTPPTRYFGFLIPFLLALVINGRFAFGLFGLSLILLVLVRVRLYGFRFWHVIAGLAGLLFTSVSSGIFTVGLLFAILTIIEFARSGNAQHEVRVRRLLLGLFIVALGIPIGGLFWIFMMKNMSYYGEGFTAALDMISHGFGMIVNPYPLATQCRVDGDNSFLCVVGSQLAGSWFVIMMLGTALLSAAACFVLWLRKSGLLILARRGVVLSMLGGFFGLTTLLSVIFILPVWVKKNDSHPLLARSR